MTPEGWQEHLLGNVCEIKIGGTPSRNKSEYWAKDKTLGHTWVSIADLKSKWITNTKESISALGVKKSNVKLINAGTTIMSFKLTIGRVARAGIDLYTNEAIAALKPLNGHIDDDFLYYALPIAVGKIETDQAVKGATLNKKKLSDVNLLIPPLPEQKIIAAILSSVDDAIQATQAVIDQTRRVKQGLMQQLLTRGIGHTRFKQTEIGKIPEEWEVISLNEMGQNDRYVIRTGPFGSSLKSIHFRSSGIPVVTIQSLGEGEILTDGLFYVDKEKATELSEYFLQTGDLVFSRVADIGRSVVISDVDDKMLISSNLMRISVDLNRFDPRFIMYSIVGGGQVTRQIEQFSGNTGRPVVSSNTMKKLYFAVPLKAEQTAIADYIQNLEEMIRTENSYVNHLAEIKRGLMQDLLTGRVRARGSI